jgi:N-acyl amino acid synthase of PEP-CTERM/exosortase system
MFLFELINLGEGFKKYFEVVPALTDELRDHVYRIRHEVYCAELNYEPVRPDRRERDDYDAHALHCLIRSVHTREYVGCTRLVLARPGQPLYPLPVEKTCAHTIDRSIVDPQKLPRHAIAEISRLAVIARYRSRRDESKSPAPLSEESFGTAERPRFPYLTVGLYLATVELARQHNIATLLVLTEPRLAHHFRRLGVEIRQIGGPVEHRGTRVPSIMAVASIIEGLNFVVRPLYKVVAEEVLAGMRAQGRTPLAERPSAAVTMP